jgi:hypothetical protein
MLIADYFSRRGSAAKVEVHLYTPEAQPMPVAGPIPGRWKPDVPLMLPKAGVFAHVQADVVASRIAAEMEGRKPMESFCGDGYCMLEAGEDLAGFAYGDFFAQPTPQVKMRQIGKAWHVGKVLLEKWWLSTPRWRRGLYGAMFRAGGKIYGIPIRA